jgi:hypothetical protein
MDRLTLRIKQLGDKVPLELLLATASGLFGEIFRGVTVCSELQGGCLGVFSPAMILHTSAMSSILSAAIDQ